MHMHGGVDGYGSCWDMPRRFVAAMPWTALPRMWCCRDNGNATNAALELVLHVCNRIKITELYDLLSNAGIARRTSISRGSAS